MPETAQIDENKLRNDAAQAERTRISTIQAINKKLAGKIPGLDDDCAKAIQDGTAVADLQKALFEKLPGVTPVGKPTLEVPERDLQRYSLPRAILAACDNKLDGIEREISEEVARVSNMKPQGFFVPLGILAPDKRADLVAGTATLGGNLIATNLMSGSFIEMLRNRSYVARLGARMLDGLVGNVTIPRQTNGSTAYWVATETTATTQSDLGFDQITLTPKCLTAWVNWSKQALVQTTPAIDQLVRSDILMQLALTMDLSALHSQTNGPTPISATTGIATVAGGTNGAAPTFAHMVSLETCLAIDNADTGTLAYLTTPQVRGVLKQTLRDTAGGGMVWTDGNTVNGYSAYASNQVKSNLTKGTATTIASAIFYGDWSQLIIGSWAGIDIVVDPYTNASTRIVRVFAHQYADFGVRHPEGFSVMLDALA